MTSADLIVYSLLAVGTALIVIPGMPWRLSLFAFFLVAHLNPSNPDLASATQLGIGNALKVTVLPTALLLRCRFAGVRLMLQMPPFLLWVALILYVAIAALWSPYPLSAIKTLGYFYAYTVTIVVLAASLRTNPEETYSAFFWSVFGALVLGVVQTYVVAGGFGGIADRFTSFVAQQSFGLFIALSVGVVLFVPRESVQGLSLRPLLLPALLGAALLNGSRTGMLLIGMLVVAGLMLWALRDRTQRRALIFTGTTSLLAIAVAVGILLVPVSSETAIEDPEDLPRAIEILGPVVGQDFDFREIGTLRFRLEMYEAIWETLRQRSINELLFGRGTASTGEIVTLGWYSYRGFDQVTVDANRVAHNEFLRVLYEWGAIGEACLLGIFLGIVFGGLRKVLRVRSHCAYMLFFSVCLTLLLFCFQNMFAAALHPSGLVASLILAQLAVLGQRKRGRLAVCPPQTVNSSGNSSGEEVE